MSLTFAELLQPSTADQIESTWLATLELAGFPVTAWQPGSTPRALIQGGARGIEEAWFTVAKLARAFVIAKGFSSGEWLDQAVQSQYQDARKPAVSTVMPLRLYDSGGGPWTITVGGLVASTADGSLQYRCTALPSGATLPLNGQLDIEVTAVAPGAAYNVTLGAVSTLVTTLPGVTCSNVSAITTLGADIESDDDLIDRVSLKWATLSTGSPTAAYLYWALTQGVGVTRARVDDGSPDGPNSLRVYVDAAGAVAGLQAYIQPAPGQGKAPCGTKVTVVVATTTTIALPLTVTVQKGFSATGQAAVLANLANLALSIDIGGLVRQADIVEAVMRETTSIDVTFSGSWVGAPNYQLAANAIPVFDTSAVVFVEGA